MSARDGSQGPDTVINILIADRYAQLADALCDKIGRDHAIEVTYAQTTEELRTSLKANKVDVLLINADFAVETGVNLISAIRRMEHGFEANPFVVIAALVHDRNKVYVPAVMEAGVDCGLIVPTPVETMVSALIGVVEERRKWVIVPPYIGPDRRPPRGEPDPSLVTVPNTMQHKLAQDRPALAKALSDIAIFAARVEDTAIEAIEGRLHRLVTQVNELSVKDMVMMLPSIRTQLSFELGVMATIPRFRSDPEKAPLLQGLQKSVLRAIPTSGADPATLSRLQAATNEMAKGLRVIPD